VLSPHRCATDSRSTTTRSGVYNGSGSTVKEDPVLLGSADLCDCIAHDLFSINFVWVLVTGLIVRFMQSAPPIRAPLFIVGTFMCGVGLTVHPSTFKVLRTHSAMQRFIHKSDTGPASSPNCRSASKRTTVILAVCGVILATSLRLPGEPVPQDSPGQEGKKAMTRSIYDFSVPTITGEEKSLADYKGKVLLVVNTASKCGFTPQFAGLESLYTKFADKGFAVLGFPCNQFGSQDPGSNDEILSFCQQNYGVSFPMFAKIDVNGSNAHPLFEYLKEQAPGVLGSKAIKWNFTKFLVDRNGKVVSRYAPATKPADIEADIAALLD
jgi:glutathione peroxidase